jgi:hypothetical protein
MDPKPYRAHDHAPAPEQPTLRDWLAMAALPALLRCDPKNSDATIASGAYALADAMLQARERCAEVRP